MIVCIILSALYPVFPDMSGKTQASPVKVLFIGRFYDQSAIDQLLSDENFLVW